MKYTLLLVICLVTVLNCVPQKTQKQLFGLADAAGLALDVASLVLPQDEAKNVLAQKQLLALKDVVKAGKKAYKFYKSHKFYFDLAFKFAQSLAQKQLFDLADAAGLALDVASLVLPQNEKPNTLAQKKLFDLGDAAGLALDVASLVLPQKELGQVVEPNLKYYHRYERNHGEKINPHVPLQKHYSNERKNRRVADHLKDQIQKTIQQTGFQVRQLNHAVVNAENNVNRDRATRDGVFRMAEQRENSIKFEINHEEKFKELYEQRLRKNQRREGTALPDQRVALEKLVTFDENRVAHWKKAEDSQQRLLQHTVQGDIRESIASEKTVAELQAKIGMLKAQLDSMKQRAHFRVARLSEKLKNVNSVIAQDIALDHKRAGNETKEAALANSKKVVAEVSL